ncbi:hypothetical protein [Nocardia brasiliensis]|uniref:hypothetical protein n=1 Tax=Nocardia brasiliensis TaxID=37326 RepID=UPI003D91922A
MSAWIAAARTQSGWLLFGFILFVQGLGSAVAEALWENSFGVAAMLRGSGFPGWSDYVIGALGAAALAVGLQRARRGVTHA